MWQPSRIMNNKPFLVRGAHERRSALQAVPCSTNGSPVTWRKYRGLSIEGPRAGGRPWVTKIKVRGYVNDNLET